MQKIRDTFLALPYPLGAIQIIRDTFLLIVDLPLSHVSFCDIAPYPVPPPPSCDETFYFFQIQCS